MKLLTLNIGLNVGAERTWSLAQVCRVLGANDFRVESSVEVNSDTEPTAVVVVSVFDLPFLAWAKLNQVSLDLKQDCIAAFNVDKQVGALIGPKAADWGPFNPAFFILPDGSRLSGANGIGKAA